MNTTIINTLGIAATSFDETLKAADLDWEAKEDTISGTDTAIVMPRKKLVYRSDSRCPLGIVGSDYTASSPRAFLQSQYEFAEFIKGQVVRAGFISDRSRAFAFVKMDHGINIPKSIRKVGDPMAVYLYSTDGWDGCTPRKTRLYIERLRCANGMASRELKADLWVSHTKQMEERYAPRWKNFLTVVRAEVAAITEEFTTLAKTRMSEAECKAFLAKLVPGEGAAAEKRRTSMLDLFHNGAGNEGASRWDAYNAVTEHNTHLRTFRETDFTSVATNRFLGVLETDTVSQRALALLQAN